VNIGGGANISFSVSGDGETLKVSGFQHGDVWSLSISDHGGGVESQKLPGDVLWTASVSKDDDQSASGKVLGPAVVGKSLTT